jgi:predicted dehydrogenase
MAGTGVALIGAGYWGTRLARTLAAADGCELRAVCDVDGVRAGEVARVHGGAATTSPTDVMRDRRIDAVVLTTPSATHEGLVAEALDAGVHVLIEKPLARTSAAAARLGERAAADDLVLMCDQTYRFAPAVATVRDAVAGAAFGPLESVESTRTNQDHSQPDLDVFWDLAYHDLAIFDAVAPLGLGGRFTVRATARDLTGVGRAHHGELSLTSLDGPSATITVDWHAARKARAMRFASAHHEVTWDDTRGPCVECDGRPVAVESGEPLAAVVAEFLGAVAESRPPSCGPAHEVPILTVLEAATASAARDGDPVIVELDVLTEGVVR